ncbi:MAG: PAS domain S-box protein, partial [Anaerolineae bacterium]|nr:PAS domain S-box protein [Anaerolineae bacterium]
MIAYILSRTNHYLSATLTLVGMLIALVIVVLLMALSPIPQRMPALNFLVVAILLTSILLEVWATILVAGVSFMIIGTFFFVPGVPFDLTYSYFVFTAIIAALLMVAQAIRTNYARQIQISESRYRQMFETNRAVKLLIDPKTGCIMDANQAAVDFYGYDRERLKSMCIQNINTLSPEEVKAEMERARSQKKDIFAFRHRLASGEIRDVEVFSSPVVVQDKQYLYSIIMDVTERNRAEKALQDNEIYLRAILNNALFGAHFYHLEADSRLIFEGANPAADAILNIRHADMIGQTIEEAFPGLKQTDIPKVYARIAAQGNQYRQEELSYHDHRIKGVYEIQAFATTPEHMAVFFTEISSRKHAQEQA